MRGFFFAGLGLATVLMFAAACSHLAPTLNLKSSVAMADQPIAVGAVHPLRATAPVRARFYDSGSAAPSGREIVKWEWQFKGGGLSLADQGWIDYTLTRGEAYKVITQPVLAKLRVTDSSGAVSAPRNVMVKITKKGNADPLADIAFTTDNRTLFHFDASGSFDPDGTIASYEWDFNGDGVYEEKTLTSSIDYSYTEGGPHSVALRVADNLGAMAVTTAEVVANYAPIPRYKVLGSEFASSGALLYTLDLSGSSDADGSIVAAMIKVKLDDATGIRNGPAFPWLLDEPYGMIGSAFFDNTFELIVTDNEGATGTIRLLFTHDSITVLE